MKHTRVVLAILAIACISTIMLSCGSSGIDTTPIQTTVVNTPTVSTQTAILTSPTLTPVITPTHTGMPIITMGIQHIMQGKSDYLSVYVDGYIIFKTETGLRPPVASGPPMRSWYTGQLTSADLSTLIDFIRSSGFVAMPEQNNFATTPPGKTVNGDNFVTVAVSYGELQKTVGAIAYLAYADMPYPLNELYNRLWNIAQSTSIVGTEVIT